MPTKRIRRIRRRNSLAPHELHYLQFGKCVEDRDGSTAWKHFVWPKDWQKLWNTHGEKILKDWREKHPDSYPYAYKEFGKPEPVNPGQSYA